MSNRDRPRTGPLTPVQDQIVSGLRNGKRQVEIARELGVAAGYVSSELALATAKFRASSPMEAVANLAMADAYQDSADLLEAEAHRFPANSALHEELMDMAGTLRKFATGLLPD